MKIHALKEPMNILEKKVFLRLVGSLKENFLSIISTVKVIIITLGHRYGPFITITDRYWPLPNLTVTSVTLIFLIKLEISVEKALPILRSVTIITQVTVKFVNVR